ncbi:DUF3179 family protein [Halanaeroarchaeum sp. HSR-CO]|nr:DUF3179 family protein [Halanaeroarchaeum sp. HSR-CO]
MTRRAVLAAGVASLAGCLGRGPVGGAVNPSSTTPDDGTGLDGEPPKGNPGGPPTAQDRLPLPGEPSSLRDRAVSGGPPKDGIPSIDSPAFVATDEASDWIDPSDPVFGLATGTETKAYPQSILVWHEICNDVVDGTPVSVTYCPLTGTAMGFARGETTFGVSGRLVNNNLIMYDRATETWWPQVLATAIPGPWNESPPIRSLREFRVVWTTWERWSTVHPHTKVLSRETGFAQRYGSDPYGSYNPRRGYYEPDSTPLFVSWGEDDRLPPKTVVIGTRAADGAAAFEKNALREGRRIEGNRGGSQLVATYDPHLDTGYVYENPSRAQFEVRDDTFVAESEDSFTAAELPLERTLAFDAMWFAWSGFYPETTLYD